MINDIYSTKERASFQKYMQKNQNDTQFELQICTVHFLVNT